MKLLKTTLFIAIVLFATACGKDKDKSKTKTPPGNGNTFFVKINGVDYNPATTVALNNVQGTNIIISGSQSNGDNVAINFPVTVKTGESFTGSKLIASFDASGGGGCLSTAVKSLTITKHDEAAKKISGTFSFTCKDLEQSSPDRQFTEGKFDVTYK